MLNIDKDAEGRINLKYDVAGTTEIVKELPLRYMVVGNFSGDRELPPLEERGPVPVKRSDFDNVMASLRPTLTLDRVVTVSVDKQPGPSAEVTHAITLEFNSMADFHPDNLLKQLTTPRPGSSTAPIEALALAKKVREALVALRGPMGNRAAFRRAMEEYIKDGNERAKLERALGIAP